MLIAAVIVSSTVLAFGQHASAPNGYYPYSYNGDTFTGKVVSVDDSSQGLTLRFENQKKQLDFVGRFQQPCAVPTKNGQPMRPSDIPLGTDLTAYYTPAKDKKTGQEENMIIGIALNSFNGSPIPEDKRKMYFCSAKEQPVIFRAYR